MISLLASFAVRTVLIFTLLLLIVQLMGKREIGQLAPFDFAVSVTIGSIAAAPLVRGDTDPIAAAVSLVSFAVLHISLAVASYRFPSVERLASGIPTPLIEDGRIDERSMRQTLVNTEELLSLLRLKGAASMDEVQSAILEPCGDLSVSMRTRFRPVTAADLGGSTPYRGLSVVLIDDGEIKDDALQRLGLDRTYLLDQLERRGITEPNEVLLAILDTTGSLYVQKSAHGSRVRTRDPRSTG